MSLITFHYTPTQINETKQNNLTTCRLVSAVINTNIAHTHPDTKSFGISYPNASAISLLPILAMH